MSAKVTPLADQVAAVCAKLQIKLGHAATRLARQISARAEAKKR